MTQTTVALSQLTIDDKANVRKSGRGAEPQYVGSITAKGIIEPLVVRKNGAGYKVINGGKRLASLGYMRDEGLSAQGVLVTAEYPVPVVIRDENDADARDTSLITNIVRADMHPVEECEAFARMVKDDGKKPADIAATYGLDIKRVEQRLALGAKLTPAVREAWRKDEIDAEEAEALTLAPDAKSMDAALDKVLNADWRMDRRQIANLFKIKGDIGAALNFVTVKAYESRKGKVTLDLFGSNHRVSDEKLLKAMLIEKLDDICKTLLSNGWSFAKVVHNSYGNYEYGRIEPKTSASKEEKERIRELEQLMRDEDDDNPETVAAFAEHERLEAEIAARSFTAEQKAKSGCLVCFDARLKIDYGRVKPEEKKKIEAQERAATRKKKVKAAGANNGGAGVLSAAIVQRLSEQLTAAASDTIAKADGALTLALILAGFASHGSIICVRENGLGTKKAKTFSTSGNFATALAGFLKMKQPDQLKALAEVAAAAVDLQALNALAPAHKDPKKAALCNALPAAEMNKALRARFDAKDYFDSVSKPIALKAITEAINADEARKVSSKPKGEIAKFAISNVPKTGWLPAELRTAHYDGPASKAAKTKAAKKKAA
jgi:ParB family chromosome partitioning protein